MPRRPRNFEPGGIYHITARGNRKQPIFLSDGDYESLLTLLARISAQLKWLCHAYCLMPNHYHLVIEMCHVNLSTGLQLLNGRYAQAFNSRHGTQGHLFQGRFHAAVVESDAHLLELARYLALNPIRAGLCMSAAEWPWSSYRAVAGLATPATFLNVDRVLEFWSSDPQRGREIFQRFVRDPRRETFADRAEPAMPGVRPRAWLV